MRKSSEIDLIDISVTYFELPIDEAKLLRTGCNDMECNKRNKVIAKSDAIKIFKQNYEIGDEETCFCSVNAVRANQIKDYYGDEIFPEIETNLAGWFIFLDEMSYANWKHECKYFFIIDEKHIYKEIHTVGFSDSVLMQEVL